MTAPNDSGPWWVTDAKAAGGTLVIKFKVIGGQPWFIQVCGPPPPGPWPKGEVLRRAAQQFCRRNADFILGAERAA